MKNEPTTGTPKGESYYAKNREARKAYQREYYKRKKERIMRKREVGRTLDDEGQSDYDRYQAEYYAQNRDRILKRRREKYKKQREATGKRYKPRSKQSE
jgi:hypothetical protein